VTVHSYESEASFDIFIDGEDIHGFPMTWPVCQACEKGWTDLSDIEQPGTGLLVKKIRYVGVTSVLSICQVLAYPGANVSFGSNVELAVVNVGSGFPHIVANSGTLQGLFGPRVVLQGRGDWSPPSTPYTVHPEQTSCVTSFISNNPSSQVEKDLASP